MTGEAGSTSTVTLTGPGGTVIKTIGNDGGVQPVVLSAAELAILGNGAIEVGIQTRDAAGNVTTTPDVNDGDFILDTQAPTISVNTPLAGDGYLNSPESGTALTVSGTTTGVEDGQVVTVRVGSNTYTATVAGNALSLIHI